MPAFALHVDSCKELFEKFKLRKQSSQFALVAIGSVLPDLQEFGILKNVHGNSEKFLQYLLKTDPKYAPLAIGMILHEELDRVIDTQFVNPHMAEARELLEQYKISSEKVSLAAHYLIDHTVNCEAIEKKPEILKLTESIKKKLSHKRAHKIAYHLSSFFGGDQDQVLKAMHTFRDFNNRLRLTALVAKPVILPEKHVMNVLKTHRCRPTPMAALDAVDGSLHRHRNAPMFAVS